MSNFLEDDWPEQYKTPFSHYSNPFDHTPTLTLPPSTSSVAHGSGYLQPRMSPAFGHGVEDLIFTAVTSGSMEGLGISHATANPPSRATLSGVSSPSLGMSNKTAWYDQSATSRVRSFTAPAPQSMPPTPQTSALPPTLISQPVPIAPHPASAPLRLGKRLRNDDQSETGRSPQRHRSNSNQNSQFSGANRPQTELSEEDQLLLKLKHEENLPWKDIAREFETRLGRTYQVPALQMRHKRLRERLRTWTEDDISALEAAYDYWEKSKFEIVAQKMLEFGAQEKWPAKYCERKWEELHPETASATSNIPTPGHQGALQLGPSAAPSTDNWMPQDQGSEFEYSQSTPSITMISRSPVTFATPVINRSPVQRSPVPAKNEHKFEQ
ncbi:hypothetical protein EPUS_02970 [Endocarpon pusillum Z07020]|uniref:Myb-like domain-containing protein n=1 Tax=Endocarpon pusillum (strain Z07020 / HMAS-L-300199) TaxID=1263415 RepID=U1HSK8_ENDPU|nr:uncharacterized protein EPUS_02970 [Endocarpon pusillum Z07020]ERF72179.1 hypothetical protein EPUS_02970 [Endocarpon pusillum Z07020]